MTHSKNSPPPEKSPPSLGDLVAVLRVIDLFWSHRAADELERLYVIECASRPALHANKVQAEEIERLTAELAMRPSEYRDHYRELYEQMKAERDRLRAALERINHADGDDEFRPRQIAREALAGGKDG